MSHKQKVQFTERYTEPVKRKIDITRVKEKLFKPDRLTFNLSFITRDNKYNFSGKHFDKRTKMALFDKMVRLSSDTYVSVLSLSKDQGLEKLPEKAVSITINPEFINTNRHRSCQEGLWIFRLSKKGRVIGKIQGLTFYVLAVDTTFDLYEH